MYLLNERISFKSMKNRVPQLLEIFVERRVHSFSELVYLQKTRNFYEEKHLNIQKKKDLKIYIHSSAGFTLRKFENFGVKQRHRQSHQELFSGRACCAW